MNWYVLKKILVSTNLLDPIHETGIPKLGFMIIPCLKFQAQYILYTFGSIQYTYCKYSCDS